jgi:PhzF family phenazine biosynthesis protein
MSAPASRRFHQLDVFTAKALRGNPLAVVHAAQGLDDAAMAAFARWTNLSETTFLLPPTVAGADYRVRIFTPGGELPFAGHPTLGSCWAWLAAGGLPKDAEVVVQECAVGLVRVRRQGARLAFAAPPLRRSGPLNAALRTQIATALRLSEGDIVQHQWVDNGPGWCAVMLASAAQVLALQPDWPVLGALKLGVIGPHAAGHDAAFEVRAFVGDGDYEDPVTGSLNASLAQWLIGAGLAPASYIAAQGTAMQRAGRVYLQAERGTVWVGGDVTPCIEGSVAL